MSSELDALFEDAPPPAATEFYTDAPWYPALVGCTACTCRAEAKRVVPGDGPLTARLAFLGRNPGKDEDKNGLPFIGKAGDELNTWIKTLGLDRQRVLVTNLTKCYTRDDRPPTVKEIQTCAPKWLGEELATFADLRVLITLGDDASRFVLKMHAPSVSKFTFAPTRVALDAAPGRQFIVIPVAHPAYVLRKPGVRPSLTDPDAGLLKQIEEYLRTREPDVYAASR